MLSPFLCERKALAEKKRNSPEGEFNSK